MKQFGLIGKPLVQSFSKKFFTAKFEAEKIDAKYDLFELQEIAEFTGLKNMPDLCGLNVTIPYKQLVMPYLDEMDDTAAKIGAVNVIKFIHRDNTLILKGYNSDAIGFENSIKPLIKPFHKKALILGTGGASKAVDYILKKLNIETTFVSRTAKPGMLTYNLLTKEIIEDNLVIVNSSPVGTFPNIDECPDIPYQYIIDKHLLYDVIYNPAETLFLKLGKERGAVIMNGESMLTGQAVAAWKIWTEE